MSLPRFHASRNKVFSRYKINALNRGLLFSITKEQFTRICENKCHYCGSCPTPPLSQMKANYNGYWKHNGLDRIDNSKGYILSNIQACCYPCNRLKSNNDENDFLSQIANILLHSGLVGNKDVED